MTLTGVNALLKTMIDKGYQNSFPPGENRGEAVSIARTPAVSATAIVSNYTSAEIQKVGSEVINAKDLKIRVLKSDTLTSLTTADVIIRGGKNYRLISVDPEPPGGDEIIEWICQGRY